MTYPAWDHDLSILCSDAPSDVRAEAAARVEATIKSMTEALEKIAKDAPVEFEEYPGGGTTDDEYFRGEQNEHFRCAEIARPLLPRQRQAG